MATPSATRTTCPYCGVGCGVIATTAPDGVLAVRGDPDHPANLGRLCSKGAALAETLDLDGRLLHPVMDGRRVDWSSALDRVATTFSRTIAEHGPDSVAFYVSGQLLTEVYYVTNKLMKGFIGSANIDTNSRLCMASAVAGYKRAFGADTVPCDYEDLETADLVVLVGSNLAWCHPVLYQRLSAAKARRPEMRVVVVDPRRTMTADLADLHLPIAPGSDVALFNGLLAYLDAAGAANRAYVARHTSGIDAALAAVGSNAFDVAVDAIGLSAVTLRRFYDAFARTERVVTGFSQGVNQSTSGTDKVNAIINCHLLTGRIGRPGMGPFSITGQPNAMGGREVGGLANQLAAHMELADPVHRARVQRFWQSPRIAEKPGLKAVELFEAVRAGRVRALWIAATNPVDSLPDADRVKAAITACPFVVVSDVMVETDTAALAHVKLPAAAWSEKDGTVTNSERRVSRQRGFRRAPGEARPDWWMICEVARRMGWGTAFDYAGPAEIFAEHAALSAFENDGARDFDLSALTSLDHARYDALDPVQWPARGDAARVRLFADGNFFTPDRRARFVATPARSPASAPSIEFPMTLNTGRIRDQWHTMTRTGTVPRLLAHIAEPFAELYPADARRLGIEPASVVEIESARGRVLVRALLSEGQRPGSVFVPLHWTDQLASRARVDALVAPHTDPVSGQPELKITPVAVRPYRAAWYGFAVTAERPCAIDAAYRVIAPLPGGWRVELADARTPADWTSFARALLGLEGDAELLAYHDAASRRHRFAAFQEGRLRGAFFAAPEPVAVSRSWLAEQLAASELSTTDRLRLLAGRGGAGAEEQGATVCACFRVGAGSIARAARQGCATVDAVGTATQAGTGCGSCRGEIRRIIDDVALPKAG
jgi:assimilatory nitrate reductase catalytic subunit